MSEIDTVIVHPIVLLGITDHVRRMSKMSRGRVMGVLLGSHQNGTVDCATSFAIPFEENKTTNVWFFDTDYLEKIEKMQRRINIREKIVGYYSSSNKLNAIDLEIDEMFRKYCPNPVYVTLDIHNQIGDVPAKAYMTEEIIDRSGREGERMFKQLNVKIEGLPIEEAGVQHVLRGIRDSSVVSIYNQINDKVVSLRGIEDRLKTCIDYIDSCSPTNPPNAEIMNELQGIVNILPNLHLDSIQEAMTTKTNDIYMVLYLSTLVRTVVSLHDLVKSKEDALKKTEKKAAVLEMEDSDDDMFFYYDYHV
ncbi:26S proteasome non-ATPase regulatory subunit [Blastocystis sp. subtype 4]|uniref:26S proteasome non-ATPase regulatory subunit n=1 Tax=Blastocystis sp. subtype 4 TaxID=944170 RepID=UPI000711969D|nr:26S proteasome non-ATPase regulatory subunit [Blastocystis sp. subtype 4]KNB45727.1 26S proteasome non-ATPase regulatory subunit [Blastocystis sp. subtype 4]|eukprot:XP_014529170.1 26S proteasome non-ATPase regulatory subunit [Blastocystis sp. subtype 4]